MVACSLLSSVYADYSIHCQILPLPPSGPSPSDSLVFCPRSPSPSPCAFTLICSWMSLGIVNYLMPFFIEPSYEEINFASNAICSLPHLPNIPQNHFYYWMILLLQDRHFQIHLYLIPFLTLGCFIVSFSLQLVQLSL